MRRLQLPWKGATSLLLRCLVTRSALSSSGKTLFLVSRGHCLFFSYVLQRFLRFSTGENDCDRQQKLNSKFAAGNIMENINNRLGFVSVLGKIYLCAVLSGKTEKLFKNSLFVVLKVVKDTSTQNNCNYCKHINQNVARCKRKKF